MQHHPLNDTFKFGTALTIYVGLMRFAFLDWIRWGWFALGLLLGLGIFELDKRILHPYYAEGHTHTPFITKSVLFMTLWVPLAIFVVYSGGSALGSGLVLGIGWELSWELLRLRQPAKSETFAATINSGQEPLTGQEKKWLIRVVTAVFTILSFLLYV